MATPANDLNIQTPGFVTFDGISTFNGRTLTAGTGISISNGSGVSGNPIISSTAAATDLHTAKWIVNAIPNSGGNQTTITAAIAAAVSGETIFIMPGTYTEDLTLKAGVNLTAFQCDSSSNATGHVIISGNATFSTAGTVSISGVQLQTNAAAFLTLSGSAASVVNLNNCYLNCSNNTGISFTANNVSAAVNLYNCSGNLGTTGIALIISTSTGAFLMKNSIFTNGGGSTTSNSTSAGLFNFIDSVIANPMTTTSTGSFNGQNLTIQTSTQNVTSLIANGSGGNNLYNSILASGSSSAISVGSAAVIAVGFSTLLSSNINTVTGLGVIQYTNIGQSTTPGLINASTNTGLVLDVGPISFDGGTNLLSNYTEGTFVPTMTGGSVSGTTTYSSQNGYYRRIGNLVIVQFTVVGTAATGTGNVLFGGFPFTIKNQTNGSPIGSLLTSNGATFIFPVGTTAPVLLGLVNTNTAVSWVNGSATSGVQQMVNTTFNFQGTLAYEI